MKPGVPGVQGRACDADDGRKRKKSDVDPVSFCSGFDDEAPLELLSEPAAALRYSRHAYLSM
jgi:hypothetical protein